MFLKKKPTSTSFEFLITPDENTIDIVLLKPILIGKEYISEFNFQYDYFFDWLVKQGLNIRRETKHDSIANITIQTIRVVTKEEYLLPQLFDQNIVKEHILAFINHYKTITKCQ